MVSHVLHLADAGSSARLRQLPISRVTILGWRAVDPHRFTLTYTVCQLRLLWNPLLTGAANFALILASLACAAVRLASIDLRSTVGRFPPREFDSASRWRCISRSL